MLICLIASAVECFYQDPFAPTVALIAKNKSIKIPLRIGQYKENVKRKKSPFNA